MPKGNSKTLFVGGLSIYIGEQELYQYFQAYSKVLKVVFLRERETGKSKGYAFVTLKDADVAYDLASRKHVIMGRQVECQVAARKCEKTLNSEVRMRRKLYVTNITPHLSDANFRQFFLAFGEVHNCYIIKNPELNCNRNYGFVEFEDPDVTDYLLNLQTPLVIGGVRVYIHPFKDKDQVKHESDAYSSKKPNKKSKSKSNINGQDVGPAVHGADSSIFTETDHVAPDQNYNQLLPSNPSAARVHQSSFKRPLKFSQKHPIKGEAQPNEDGANYHLRISNPGNSGMIANCTKSVLLYDQPEGRYQMNHVTMIKCGHCQRFYSYHIVTTGRGLQTEQDSCSCKPLQHREFSLFFKGSRSDHSEVSRRYERAEKSGSRDRVNTVHGSTSSS